MQNCKTGVLVKLGSKLQMSLSKRSDNVVLRCELSELASASHLSEAIKCLVANGRLIRLSTGVYAKTRPDARGKTQLLAGGDALVKEVLAKLGVKFRSVTLVQEGAINCVGRCGGESDFAQARSRRHRGALHQPWQVGARCRGRPVMSTRCRRRMFGSM